MTDRPNADLSRLAQVSRRTALTTFGAAGAAALLAACGRTSSSDTSTASSTSAATSTSSSPTTARESTATTAGACAALTREQEQGPYYYPVAAIRSDITGGKPGVPMKLRLTVQDVKTCKPVANATVDIWQADALGSYSDTASGLYLRGLQPTGADGAATFTSIYPGWYPQRTNHVHVKVHTGGHISHTGNLFFPEAVSTAVAEIAPYTDSTVTRVTLTDDFVYTGQHGSGSIMTLTPVDPAKPGAGYTASMVLGIDTSATPSPIGISGTVS